jgi:photosystem II stability/assembly factor-like uncharacterized protein
MSPALVAALILGLAVTGADAVDVSVGQSGWNWGNPQPQGNTLRAIEFVGDRGYAAGDFGTLLRSDDRGRTWTGVPTALTGSLKRVRTVGENTLVVGSGCALRRSDDGGVTFRRLPFASTETDCGATLASFDFPTATTGYVLRADGSVPRTVDGGTSFDGRAPVPGTPSADPAGTASPTDLVFTGESTGFATVSGPDGGAIYRTTDGGGSWFQRTTSTAGLNALFFADASTGYAVGSANTVLKTTDGGENWSVVALPDDIPSDTLTSIRCASAPSCLVSTAGGERLLRTNDGGDHWKALAPSARKVFAAAWASATNAMAVGERGVTVLSTNATSGNPSFVPVGDQPLTGSFQRLRATSGALAYAPDGNGRLARSVDGGRRWTTVQVPTSEDLRDVWFLDASNGFVLDSTGQAQATGDGGASWSPLAPATDAKPRAIYAVDMSLVMLFGPKGVYRSEEGGDTAFTRVKGKAARSALSDYDSASDGTLFAYGRKALIVSGDRGATWQAVHAPVKKPRYRKVDFVTATTGYALMTDGRLYRTDNTGRRWTQLLGTGTAAAYDLSFGDASSGFLAVRGFGGGVDGGWVLHTSDGGVSWRPQLIGQEPLADRGLATPTLDTAFALAGGADLFYTNSGGDSGGETTLSLRPGRRVITRARKVTLSGRLTPAVPGARVVVSARTDGTSGWRVAGAVVAGPDGKFSLRVKLRQTTHFVAQWRGDADHNGDGTAPTRVTRK